ncbi:metal ABC transporter permease [Verrucomicrobiaceae bacterium N1E253]|uniref:Metal ABC transporter permease n=1 Tax=Oceaniferula marina TaxID=2748318 RepID=A0A851GER3_9BACT|nr:metal ABC transporter permease [Oceaniferula marina]
MTDFFQTLDTLFFQRALLAAAVIGFTNGFFSGFVLLQRSALSIGALSHTMLPGIATVVLITGVLSQLGAFVGALFAALIVGLGSVAVARGSRIPQGTALAIFFTTAFAAGIIIQRHTGTAAELENWLFGNILAVSNSDLWTFLIIATVTLTLSTLFMRPLLITLFEPHVAAAQGVKVRSMQYLLFGLLILALVASFQALGSVLSIGLLVAPAAIVSLFTNKTSWLFWGGGIIGSLGSVIAILLSAAAETPTGPSIVIVLGCIFILACIFSPRYGLRRRKAISLRPTRHHQS